MSEGRLKRRLTPELPEPQYVYVYAYIHITILKNVIITH